MLKLFAIIGFVLIFTAPNVFAQQKGPQGPSPVYATKVILKDFADTVEALGTTRSNEMVVITSDVSEKVTAIHFVEGQDVKKGDLLITLAKAEENAGLRAAQAELSEAQSAFNRAEDLQKDQAISKATLDERLAALRQARAAVSAISARLEDLVITAPFDGVAGLREVSIGALIQPSDKITTVDDISKIKVDFDVPSIFLPTLKAGLGFTGTVEAYGNREFTGEVQTVNTQVDPITRMIKVRGIIPNDDKALKPGLLMKINLVKNDRKALIIPEEALIKRASKNFVYVVKDNEAKKQAIETEIQIGARKAGDVEVISGLNEGDLIVAHGALKLRDGAAIAINAIEEGDMPLSELLEQAAQNKAQIENQNDGVDKD